MFFIRQFKSIYFPPQHNLSNITKPSEQIGLNKTFGLMIEDMSHAVLLELETPRGDCH